MLDIVVMANGNAWPKEEPCAFFFNSVVNLRKRLRKPGKQGGPTTYAFFFTGNKFPVVKKFYKNNIYNNNSYHILSIYYLSGTVLSSLCIITHFVLTTNL